MSVSNKQIIFTKIPTTYPVAGEHIQVRESTIDLEKELPQGDFILKTLVLSVDPYMRGMMRDPSIKSYSPPYALNQSVAGDNMSVVIKSNNPDFKVDDLVYGRTGLGLFQEYVQVSAEYAKEAYVVRNDSKKTGLPLDHYAGTLAMPGLTGYYGLIKIGKPKKGETLFISSAAGAVGQLVGQLAKALGLYVVGSAGTDEKVEYLKSIGFDDAFNYKTGTIQDNLIKTCPRGIDVYYDNVGGQTLDVVLNHANDFARVVVCGMISQYNLTSFEPLYNSIFFITKRIRMEGFCICDHYDVEPEFLEKVTPLVANNQIKYRYDVAQGIESFSDALVDVLRGNIFGKKIIRVADL